MRKEYRTDQNDDTHIFVCANHLKFAVCIPQSPPLFCVRILTAGQVGRPWNSRRSVEPHISWPSWSMLRCVAMGWPWEWRRVEFLATCPLLIWHSCYSYGRSPFLKEKYRKVIHRLGLPWYSIAMLDKQRVNTHSCCRYTLPPHFVSGAGEFLLGRYLPKMVDIANSGTVSRLRYQSLISEEASGYELRYKN